MEKSEYDMFFDNSYIVGILNKNKDNIQRFEVIDSYYLNIYFTDATYIEIEPEYGALYFMHKSK